MTDATRVGFEMDEAHFSWGGHESEDMAMDMISWRDVWWGGASSTSETYVNRRPRWPSYYISHALTPVEISKFH